MSRLLTVRNLHTTFFTQDGEIKAVKGVDFHLDKGETMGIVGESGSGKSVTSLSILRLLPPAGRIVDGEIILEGSNLTEAGSAELRKVRDLFDKVQIPDASRRYGSYPHEFSGGMRQRVMIAMALACKPPLLIADEPTTALDVTIQDQILKLLRNLQDEMQMSIIFISHDLGVVAEICSRVMVMYGGMVMEYAGIETIFTDPKHPYTIGLLESIPSIVQDRNVSLVPIPGSPPDMSNPPEGCPFHPRCRHARKICSLKVPPMFETSENHGSRCWLLDENAPQSNNPFAGTAAADGGHRV